MLERSLAARLRPRPVQVVNAGVPSYGQREMAKLFAREALALEPDLVLATFFFGNDLSDNLAPGYTVRGGLLVKPGMAAILDGSPRLSFALEHSDLLLAYELWQLEQKTGEPPLRDAPVDPESLAVQAPGLRWVGRKSDEESEEAWRVLEQEIGRIRRAADEHGIRSAIVHVPLPYQFDPARWEAIVAHHGVRAEDYDVELISRRLTEACERAGIELLDLAQVWRGRGAVEALYFPLNRHWNAAGHASAAAAIEDFLVERGWLEP